MCGSDSAVNPCGGVKQSLPRQAQTAAPIPSGKLFFVKICVSSVFAGGWLRQSALNLDFASS